MSRPVAGRAREGALLLLFQRDQRPDADTLRAAIANAGRLSVTQELSGGEPGSAVTDVEVLRDGMTYDVCGLAPGEPMPLASIAHRFDSDLAPDVAALEAVGIQPGPHLEAGARSLPVIRTMMGIVADLAPYLPGLAGIAWPPARTLVGPGLFVSSMSSWLAGGAFPALGLTALSDDPEGGMRTEGLAWFIGQELLIAADIAKDRVAAARLAIRLVNQLVLQGRVTASEAIVGPDGGRLALDPSRDGKTVRVRRG